MPGNIGWQGLIIILLVVLVIFGPKRIPEIARSLGRGINEFKDSVSGEHKHDDDEVHTEPAQIAQASTTEPEPQPQPRERDTVV